MNRPFCIKCGLKPRESKGNGQYRSLCWKCRDPTRTANRQFRKNAVIKSKMIPEQLKCWICEFVPKHMAQMDLDHIDGDRHNNEPSNHQLLCANCHRLKTIIQKDHLKRYNYGY